MDLIPPTSALILLLSETSLVDFFNFCAIIVTTISSAFTGISSAVAIDLAPTTLGPAEEVDGWGDGVAGAGTGA